MPSTPPTSPSGDRRSALRFIIIMGLVAMCGDITYEGARSLTGPYLGLLGASAASIGFFVGLGELLGYGLRVVTGWLADRTGAYALLTALGYGLNLIAVPGLAFVGDYRAALGLVLLERVAKAIRSPARSTLVADAAAELGPGKGFALDEVLDQLGAVLGPSLVGLAIWLRGGSLLERYQTGLLILALPVFGSLFLLAVARRRPHLAAPQAPTPPPLRRALFLYLFAIALLGAGFLDWALAAYHLGRRGLVAAETLPLLYAVLMAVDAVGALIFGALFDRISVRVLLISTVVSAVCVPLLFLGSTRKVVLVGAALWALGLGAQEAVFKAAIARFIDKPQRGRAYGTFFALFGLAWFLGSALMGWLYERSPSQLVGFSVAVQLAALPLLAWSARAAGPKGAAPA